jgi:predicted PurR-regulated permease PerM
VGWAVLGVRLGALAGMAVGALTLIPLANLLVLAPVALMSLLDVASDVHSWAWFAGMLGAFTLGQIAESVLNPLIVGDAVQLDTLTMLVALFAGGAVGGFLGLLLAVPVAATARILAEELLLPRWRAWADEA